MPYVIAALIFVLGLSMLIAGATGVGPGPLFGAVLGKHLPSSSAKTSTSSSSSADAATGQAYQWAVTA